MKTKQPALDFTGKFAPLEPAICIVLSYEVPLPDGDDANGYIGFIKKVGGFDPWNSTLTAMAWSDDQEVAHYLDSMTGAFERGFLSQTEWPSQLFKSSDDFHAFIEELEDYEYRICDRHHRMLEALVNSHVEVIVTADHAAEGLRDAAAALDAFK